MGTIVTCSGMERFATMICGQEVLIKETKWHVLFSVKMGGLRIGLEIIKEK